MIQKSRAAARRGFHPDFSALPFEHALRDGEAQPLAAGHVGIQPVENFKDLGLVLGSDADAVVRNFINCLVAAHPAARQPRATAARGGDT